MKGEFEMVQSSLPRLPDIDEVPRFSEADRECLSDVRAVLARHGALRRFGMTLLHQHFDIAGDEVLVEEIDVKNRILISRPEKISDAADAMETSWRLDDPTGMARRRQVCLEPAFTMARHGQRHFR